MFQQEIKDAASVNSSVGNRYRRIVLHEGILAPATLLQVIKDGVKQLVLNAIEIVIVNLLIHIYAPSQNTTGLPVDECDTRNLQVFTLVYLVLRRMPVLRSSSCYCYGGWIIPLSSTVPPGRDGVTKWYHALARGAP